MNEQLILNQNSQEEPKIPIAKEVFNESRSIKDISGKEITVGDIVVKNDKDWLVMGFKNFEENRYNELGDKTSSLFARLVKYENQKPNFSIESSNLEGELTLKEKWQPKYGDGEIIKLYDIVMADVEKYFFEIYNKKLKIIGFNLDGSVRIEVLDTGKKGNTDPKKLRVV